MNSEETRRKLPGRTRRAEEQHLKETLEIIRKNVEHYTKEVAALRTDIDDMQAHFHDDNPELINTLENAYTMYDFQNRTLERNKRALKKPYFGRIDFYDETMDTDEAFYIGRCGISKDATHPLVIDWRAPVANVYYDNGLGKCSYLAPEGNELPIDLKLKRTYEIADGNLLNMFDTEVIANDDLLTSYLSKNKQAVLGEIVATIQKEQNEIIRKSPYHNCLVQGVAGSGKTTVAMHRISYILYNYADKFRPEDFYIVGSNQILLNYITSVLPDLDVFGIKQMTMEQLFVRLLYEDWDEKKYCIKGQGFNPAKSKDCPDRSGAGPAALSANPFTHTAEPIYSEPERTYNNSTCKGKLAWFRDLEEFCRKLELESISREPVYLNRRQFVEGIVNGKAGVHDLRENDVTIYESDEEKLAATPRILFMDTESIERYIRENPTVSIQSKINMLNERLRTKIKDEFLGKEVSYTEAEMKAILKSYHGWFGGRSWKGSVFELYEQFLQEQIAKGFDVDMPETAASVSGDINAHTSTGTKVYATDDTFIDGAANQIVAPVTYFDVYDLAALAYLYKRVKETEVIREAHHVVIDEAQDYGMMVYSALKFCMNDCTYTIMGDVSQNIHFDYGLNDWEELKALYLKDNLDSFGILKKSYRNTVEISNFATKILHHGTFSMYPVEPIIRHGEEPRIIRVPITGTACAAVSNLTAAAAPAILDSTGSAIGIRSNNQINTHVPNLSLVHSGLDYADGYTHSHDALWEKTVEICHEWQEKGLDTIAIICRSESAARYASAELGQRLELMHNPLETAEFGNGIMVLPVEYTKGLEFDAVLILDPIREDYPVDDGHAKLLYVAATRALHELCVLYTDNLTGLLADPAPKAAVEVIEDYASKKPAVVVSRVKRPDQNAGTDTMKLLASKKFTPTGSAKSAPTRSFGVNAKPVNNAATGNDSALGGYSSRGISVSTKPSTTHADFSFGTMPSNDLLRPMGYVKSDRAIRWVNKQNDGVYLQSTYGVLRISPITENIIRVSFAKEQDSLPASHEKIALNKPMKGWKYRESPKLLELVTAKLYLQVDKATGTIYYMTGDKRPLLAERSRESRILEKPTYGNPRARLYLDWVKNETLNALGTGTRATLSLKGTARYISHCNGISGQSPLARNAALLKESAAATQSPLSNPKNVERLPMIVSDRGYGLVIASTAPTLCCTLPTYGMHVCVDGADVLDYYLIAGKNTEEIIGNYRKLCGEL